MILRQLRREFSVKSNNIEHRMFCHITENWRGSRLISEVVVNLIASTKTSKSLRVKAELDPNCYPKRVRVTDQQMAQIQLQPGTFNGEWNYTITREKHPKMKIFFRSGCFLTTPDQNCRPNRARVQAGRSHLGRRSIP